MLMMFLGSQSMNEEEKFNKSCKVCGMFDVTLKILMLLKFNLNGNLQALQKKVLIHFNPFSSTFYI